MGDKHNSRAGCAPDARDLALKHLTGLCIQRTERLVHQDDGRFVGEHAGDLHPLPHTTREFRRIFVSRMRQPDEAQKSECQLFTLPPPHPADTRPVFDVLFDAEPGKQNLGTLKHDAAIDARS